jgi:hypothetical protein
MATIIFQLSTDWLLPGQATFSTGGMSAILTSTHETTNTLYTQFLPSITKNKTLIFISDENAQAVALFKVKTPFVTG